MRSLAHADRASGRQPRRPWAAVLLLSLVLLPVLPAQALEFRCENRGDVRFIRVDIPGEEHLCEVNVKYEYTGEQKTMWYADNDSLFCSARAYELSAKYENTWQFECAQWPDHDGVDLLAPSQRAILDQRLKSRMQQAEATDEASDVVGVRAVASTLLDAQAGTLALQYFLSDGSDRTELISTDEDGWQLFATLEDLAQYITGPASVDTALISSVTDAGTLEISTTVATGNPGERCHGQQVLGMDGKASARPRTQHRVICQSLQTADNEN